VRAVFAIPQVHPRRAMLGGEIDAATDRPDCPTEPSTSNSRGSRDELRRFVPPGVTLELEG